MEETSQDCKPPPPTHSPPAAPAEADAPSPVPSPVEKPCSPTVTKVNSVEEGTKITNNCIDSSNDLTSSTVPIVKANKDLSPVVDGEDKLQPAEKVPPTTESSVSHNSAQSSTPEIVNSSDKYTPSSHIEDSVEKEKAEDDKRQIDDDNVPPTTNSSSAEPVDLSCPEKPDQQAEESVESESKSPPPSVVEPAKTTSKPPSPEPVVSDVPREPSPIPETKPTTPSPCAEPQSSPGPQVNSDSVSNNEPPVEIIPQRRSPTPDNCVGSGIQHTTSPEADITEKVEDAKTSSPPELEKEISPSPVTSDKEKELQTGLSSVAEGKVLQEESGNNITHVDDKTPRDECVEDSKVVEGTDKADENNEDLPTIDVTKKKDQQAEEISQSSPSFEKTPESTEIEPVAVLETKPESDSKCEDQSIAPESACTEKPIEPKANSPVEPKADSPVEPKADSPVEPKADSPIEPKADSPIDRSKGASATEEKPSPSPDPVTEKLPEDLQEKSPSGSNHIDASTKPEESLTTVNASIEKIVEYKPASPASKKCDKLFKTVSVKALSLPEAVEKMMKSSSKKSVTTVNKVDKPKKVKPASEINEKGNKSKKPSLASDAVNTNSTSKQVNSTAAKVDGEKPVKVKKASKVQIPKPKKVVSAKDTVLKSTKGKKASQTGDKVKTDKTENNVDEKEKVKIDISNTPKPEKVKKPSSATKRKNNADDTVEVPAQKKKRITKKMKESAEIDGEGTKKVNTTEKPVKEKKVPGKKAGGNKSKKNDKKLQVTGEQVSEDIQGSNTVKDTNHTKQIVKEKEKVKDDANSKEKDKVKDDAKSKEKDKIKDDLKIKEKDKTKETTKTKEKEKTKDDVKEKNKIKEDIKGKDKVKEDIKGKEKDKTKEDAKGKEKDKIKEDAKGKDKEKTKEDTKGKDKDKTKEDVKKKEKEVKATKGKKSKAAKSKEENVPDEVVSKVPKKAGVTKKKAKKLGIVEKDADFAVPEEETTDSDISQQPKMGERQSERHIKKQSPSPRRGRSKSPKVVLHDIEDLNEAEDSIPSKKIKKPLKKKETESKAKVAKQPTKQVVAKIVKNAVKIPAKKKVSKRQSSAITTNESEEQAEIEEGIDMDEDVLNKTPDISQKGRKRTPKPIPEDEISPEVKKKKRTKKKGVDIEEDGHEEAVGDVVEEKFKIKVPKTKTNKKSTKKVDSTGDSVKLSEEKKETGSDMESKDSSVKDTDTKCKDSDLQRHIDTKCAENTQEILPPSLVQNVPKEIPPCGSGQQNTSGETSDIYEKPSSYQGSVTESQIDYSERLEDQDDELLSAKLPIVYTGTAPKTPPPVQPLRHSDIKLPYGGTAPHGTPNVPLQQAAGNEPDGDRDSNNSSDTIDYNPNEDGHKHAGSRPVDPTDPQSREVLEQRIMAELAGISKPRKKRKANRIFQCSQCSFQAKTVPRFKRHLEGEHGIMNINENDYCVANDPSQELQPAPEKVAKRRGRRPHSMASSGPSDISDRMVSEFGELEGMDEFGGDGRQAPSATDDERRFKCPQCEFRGKWMFMIRKHQQIHGIYACNFCEFCDQAEDKLNEHLKQFHGDRPGSKMCKKCHRYVKICEEYEEHVANCVGREPLTCNICQKEFKYEYAFKSHMKHHEPEGKTYNCPHCDYKSAYKGNLLKHMTNAHDESRSKTVPCPQCDKMCYDQENLRKHMITHSAFKPYKCEECGKAFRWLGNLNLHMATHNPDALFKCGFDGCTRAFKSNKLLHRHMQQFHKLSPPKLDCPYVGCQMSFYKASELDRHYATHTGERRFKCDWPDCGKAFKHSDNLKVHYRTHTDEKPITCSLCDFACRQRASLQWHMKKKHSSAVGVVPENEPSGMDDLDGDIDPYMFEEGAEIDPMIKERFMAPGKKSTTPKQLPLCDQTGLNSLQQLQHQVDFLSGAQSPRSSHMRPAMGDHDSSDVQSSLEAIANDMQKYGSEAQIKAIEQEMMSMDNPGLMKDPNALVDNPDVLPNNSGQQPGQAGGPHDSHVLESPISDEESSDVHLSLPPRPEESPTTHPGQQPAYTSPMQDISSPTMRDRGMMDRLPSIPGREPVGQNNVPPPEYGSANYGQYPGSCKSDGEHGEVPVIRSQSHRGDVPPEYPHRHSDPNAGYSSMGTSLPPLNGSQAGPQPPAYDAPIDRPIEDHRRRYSDGMGYRDQNYPPNTEAMMPGEHRQDYRQDYPTTPRSDYKSDYPPPTPRSEYPPPTPRSDYPPPTPRSDYGAPPSIDDNHSLPPPQVEHNQLDAQAPQSHMSHHGSVDNSPENVSTSSSQHQAAPPAPAAESNLPPPASSSNQMPIEHTSLGPPPPFHYDLPPYSGTSASTASSVIRQPYGYGYPDPLERSRSVLPSLPTSETSQPALFPPPPPISGLPSRSQESSLYPSSYPDRSFYGQYLPPPIPSMSDRALPTVTQSLPESHVSTSASQTTVSNSSSISAEQIPRDSSSSSSTSFNVLGRSNSDLLRRTELERNYSPSQLLGHQMPPPPQSYMGHDDRARHWAQASPLSSLSSGPSLTPKDTYPNLDSYSQKSSAPSFPMPPRPEDPMAHLDMAGAYFGRHFGSPAANSSYNRQDTYRHATHMPDYRSFPHQAGGPPTDVFGRVGMNPSTLGLDKYYYPGNPMYRPQHMASTGAPFIPAPSSGAQKPYGEADYSRTAMYPQPPSAYSFDKQYLKTSQYFPGAPPHGAPPQDLQDPYRRSVIYNMMDRYY